MNSGFIMLGGPGNGSTQEEMILLGEAMLTAPTSAGVAIVDHALQDTSELIEAQANGGTIRITGWDLAAANTVTFQLLDGLTPLFGAKSLVAGVPDVLPFNNDGWFDLTPGQALNITLGGAVQVSGFVKYKVIGGTA